MNINRLKLKNIYAFADVRDLARNPYTERFDIAVARGAKCVLWNIASVCKKRIFIAMRASDRETRNQKKLCSRRKIEKQIK